MTPQEFIAKWQRANLSERSACQQHFLDLCDVLDQPKRGVCPDFPSSENGTDPFPPGGIGTVRYPRTVPRDVDCAKDLKKRTLTNLYNERPTWLDLAHKKLDKAVFAAYNWDPGLSDEELLEKLLALNLEQAGEG